MAAKPLIVENDKGERMALVDNQWVPVAKPSAIGGPVPVTRDEAISRIGFRARTGTPLVRADMDPYRSIRDPKQKAMAQAQGLGGARKETAVGRQQLDKARTGASVARQILDLSKRTSTGGLTGRFLSTGLGSALFGNANTERMNQLSLNIARNSRVPGEGSISDFDAKQFQQMAPGMDKRADTNQMWATSAMAAERAAQDHEEFKQAFAAANQTLEGADAIWDEYKNSAGRIFNDDGSFNAQRPGWRDWIKQTNQGYLNAAQAGPKRMKFNPATGEIE